MKKKLLVLTFVIAVGVTSAVSLAEEGDHHDREYGAASGSSSYGSPRSDYTPRVEEPRAEEPRTEYTPRTERRDEVPQAAPQIAQPQAATQAVVPQAAPRRHEEAATQVIAPPAAQQVQVPQAAPRRHEEAANPNPGVPAIDPAPRVRKTRVDNTQINTAPIGVQNNQVNKTRVDNNIHNTTINNNNTIINKTVVNNNTLKTRKIVVAGASAGRPADAIVKNGAVTNVNVQVNKIKVVNNIVVHQKNYYYGGHHGYYSREHIWIAASPLYYEGLGYGYYDDNGMFIALMDMALYDEVRHLYKHGYFTPDQIQMVLQASGDTWVYINGELVKIIPASYDVAVYNVDPDDEYAPPVVVVNAPVQQGSSSAW